MSSFTNSPTDPGLHPAPGPYANGVSAGAAATPRATHDLTGVTAREREVLTLIARGLSNTEITAHLHVSQATVKTHIGHLLAKLGARDRAQLVIAAYESGLV